MTFRYVEPAMTTTAHATELTIAFDVATEDGLNLTATYDSSDADEPRRTTVRFLRVREYRWIDGTAAYLHELPSDLAASLIVVDRGESMAVARMAEGIRIPGFELDVDHYRLTMVGVGVLEVVAYGVEVSATDEAATRSTFIEAVSAPWPDVGAGRYEYPEMRAEIVRSLEALADREHQRTRWGRSDPERPNYHDDLDLNVHILFDDTEVLPDPARSVPVLVRPSEVPALEVLGEILDAMIDDLGGADDDAYTSDSRWPFVVKAAAAALAACRRE